MASEVNSVSPVTLYSTEGRELIDKHKEVSSLLRCTPQTELETNLVGPQHFGV